MTAPGGEIKTADGPDFDPPHRAGAGAPAPDWLRLAGLEEMGGGVTITADRRDGLLDDLGHRLCEGRGFSVATLNLDHVVKLRRDPAFRAAYAQMSHVTADGRPVTWLSRLAGRPVELVPGSELVLPVAALAARAEAPVALFGATEGSLEGAARRLEAHAPGLRIAARIAPPMGFDPDGPEAGRMIAGIAASGARVVFIALGAPKQERLAARIAREAPGLGTLCIGAGLDFLSGAQTRAPALARRMAAEWLWRLAGDPARLWRRYAACLMLLPGLTARAMAARGRGRARPGGAR